MEQAGIGTRSGNAQGDRMAVAVEGSRERLPGCSDDHVASRLRKIGIGKEIHLAAEEEIVDRRTRRHGVAEFHKVAGIVESVEFNLHFHLLSLLRCGGCRKDELTG